MVILVIIAFFYGSTGKPVQVKVFQAPSLERCLADKDDIRASVESNSEVQSAVVYCVKQGQKV